MGAKESSRLFLIISCITGFAFTAENFAGAAPTNVFYNYDIIAETGTGFTGFEDRTSINDMGQVGFVGQLNNNPVGYESVYRGDGTAPPTPLSPGFSAANRDFSGYIQINNAGEVVARDRVSGSPPSYFIRKWNGSFATVARSGVSPGYYDFVSLPCLNNSGQVLFSALESSVVAISLYLNSGAGDVNVATYAGNLSARPMLDDQGNSVYLDPNNRIVLWNSIGTQVSVIASSSGGWSNLGDSPGISDDGSIVVFAGERGMGPGVFASIGNGVAPRKVVRIAGENGTTHPADLGTNANNSPINFASIGTFGRIGVARLPAAPSGNPRDRFIVCFLATPDAAKSVVTGDHDIFTDQPGLWVVRVDLQMSPSVETIVHPAVPVVQIGDTIGTRSVTDVWIHDPIAKATFDDSGNSCPPTRPDHRVCFWASTESGQFIARAVPFPIVIYPPIRQGNPLWGTHRYAPKQVDAYLNSLPEMSAERTALQAALPNINLRQKGCAMSSYAMCLNFLLDRADVTTSSIHERFKEQLTPITKTTITTAMDSSRAGQISGILKWKPAGTMNIPVFNGADVLHGDIWTEFRVEGIVTDDGIDQTITDDVAELAAANRQGHPVLLNIYNGGHWVMSKGVTGCAGGNPLFDVVDPGRSNGSLDGPKTAAQLMLKKGIILKRRIAFPPVGGGGFAASSLATGEPALVSVQTEGAIHVVISRPGGKRVGYDSATGTYYAEIPGSSYSPGFPISDPDNGYDEAEAAALLDYGPRIIQFASQVDEVVTVTANATLAGPFVIRFGGVTSSETLGQFVATGFLQAGGSTNFSVQFQTPAPPLFITPVSKNLVEIGWPTTCPTCALESSESLNPPWAQVTNSPTVVGTNYSVTVDGSAPRRFFRLAK